jgi:hypothetical protein
MSTQPHKLALVPLVIPPLLSAIDPSVEPERDSSSPRNKSIEAACKYLLDQDPKEKEIAFDWLLGICYIACRGLFIPDAHPEYLTVGADGVRAENNDVDRLRLFIQEFLHLYLYPFRELSAEAIQKHTDQFRFIGRKCRLALLNKIRKCARCGQRKCKECFSCTYILTHRETNKGTKVCPQCLNNLKGNSRLVCRQDCDSVPIFTSLDTPCGDDGENPLSEYVVSSLTFKHPTLDTWLRAVRPDLEALGLYEGALVFQLALEKRVSTKQVTAIWAETHNISVKTARKRRTKFLKLIEQHRDNKLVQELYNVIIDGFDRTALAVVVVPESAVTKAARLARSAAARTLADFWRGYSVEAREQAELEVSRLQEISASLDEDEIESRRRVTLFVPVYGGGEHLQEQEALELALADCTDEEIEVYHQDKSEQEADPIEADLYYSNPYDADED